MNDDDIKPNRTCHLKREGLPTENPGYTEHADEILTITRELEHGTEVDTDEVGRMFEVRAADGWCGDAFIDEIVLQPEPDTEKHADRPQRIP